MKRRGRMNERELELHARPLKCCICGDEYPRPPDGRPPVTCRSAWCISRHQRIRRGQACAFCKAPLLFRVEQVTACCSKCRAMGEKAERLVRRASAGA